MTNADASPMKLAPGVVDTIISITASEVEGIAAIGTRATSGFRSMFQSKSYNSGIDSEFENGKLNVDVHVDVYYGVVLPELAEKLRAAIADALLVQAGIEVNRIDIYVDGIQFEKPE